jgi:tol-pal system protein YbgF
MRPVRILLCALIAPIASGCFATRNDVRILQGDLLSMRAEAARADSARSRQLSAVAGQLANTLGVVTDSLRDLSARVGRFQDDTKQELYAMQQQMLRMAELTGMSQTQLQQLRVEMENRNQLPVAPAPVVPATPGDTTQRTAAPTPPQAPGPNTLYAIGREQLVAGSYSSARVAFTDLLTQFPEWPQAGDAQISIAETFVGERRLAEADSVYRVVVQKYPRSTAAPTAEYKLALSLARQGRKAEARTAMDQIPKRYPGTEVATLALDWLRANP